MKDDGGPAFPVQEQTDKAYDLWNPSPGMSLRDWFAGNEKSEPEIMSISASNEFLGRPRDHEWDYKKDYPKLLAKWRYACADAMLAEREGKNGFEEKE